MKIDRELFIELIERVFGIEQAPVSTVCSNYYDLAPGFRMQLIFTPSGDIHFNGGGSHFQITEKVITSFELDNSEYYGHYVLAPCLRFLCHSSIVFKLSFGICEIEDFQKLMRVCCNYNFLQTLKEMDEAEDAYECSGAID